MKTPEIVQIPENISELRQTINEMMRQMDDYEDLMTLRAKLIKSAYDNYISLGFTEDQALILAKDALG